jgi:hypothetical protein
VDGDKKLAFEATGGSAELVAAGAASGEAEPSKN